RRDRREQRILLVAHADAAREREQGVGTREGHAPELVVDVVVEATDELTAIDRDALGALTELHGVQRDRTDLLAQGFVVHAQPVEGLRMSAGVQVLARRTVDRVVRRILQRSRESRARERL